MKSSLNKYISSISIDESEIANIKTVVYRFLESEAISD